MQFAGCCLVGESKIGCPVNRAESKRRIILRAERSIRHLCPKSLTGVCHTIQCLGVVGFPCNEGQHSPSNTHVLWESHFKLGRNLSSPYFVLAGDRLEFGVCPTCMVSTQRMFAERRLTGFWK